MPAHPFKTGFTSGELTERLGARVDVSKYAQGASCLKNFSVHVHGGAAVRAGTVYIAETKSSGAFQFDTFQEDAFDVETGKAGVRLIPFQFSIDQAYMLEMGSGYIRFFQNREQILDVNGDPLEIASPYTGDALRALRWTQSADVLYIAHQDYAPRKLSRVTADPTFVLTEITFLPPPTTEVPLTLAADLTLSAVSGSGVTATATNPVFQTGDVDRVLKSGAGRAIINAFTSATVVTLDVLDPFEDVGPFAAGDWTLEGSPSGTMTPSAKEPLHKIIALTGSLDAFRAEDVGKYVTIHSGVVKLTVYSSPTLMSGEIQKLLTAITAAPAGAWTLEAPAWSVARGYPGTVGLQGQRLHWAGSPAQPDTGWSSVVADYENHGTGADDDDALVWTIAQDQVNVIRWLKSLKTLMVGTTGGELRVHGESDGPLTPSTIQVDDESLWGADFNVDAIRVSNLVLFLQRGARKVRELAFSFEVDGYLSPDLSLLAEHLTQDGIVEMAYLPQPDSTLLAIRSDGVLLGMTYERPEQVVAWHHHVTAGTFQSVAVIPNDCGHEIWVAVERGFHTLDNAFQASAFQADAFQVRGVALESKRFLEVFEGALNTDAALVYDGPPATQIAMPHLESAPAAAVWTERAFQEDTFQEDLVQGALMGAETGTVLDGLFTLSAARSYVEVGLPFDAHIELLPAELQLGNGSAQGRRQRYNELTLRLLCTYGDIRVGPRERGYTLPAGGDPLDWQGQLLTYPEGEGGGETEFTGDVRVTEVGWTRGSRPRIVRSESLPIVVLGVGGSIQVDDG